jgi:hypothetical protein
VKNTDLNETVDESVKFLSPLAIAKEVELVGVISAVALRLGATIFNFNRSSLTWW